MVLAAVAADARAHRADPVGDRGAFLEIGEYFRQYAGERIRGVQKPDIRLSRNAAKSGETSVGGLLPAAGGGMRGEKMAIFVQACFP